MPKTIKENSSLGHWHKYNFKIIRKKSYRKKKKEKYWG